MAKQQMSFIVDRFNKKDNTGELNSLLNDGWSVVMISSMSGTDTASSYALVILEKES